MNKIKVAKSIALFSIAVGFMVMIGWFFDVTLLTSILPQWRRMKFATALCFVFSGFVIYFLAEKKEERKDIKTFVLTVFPMLLVLIMGTLFLGSVAGFETGMENLNFVDIHEVKTPVFQGRPSVATMVNFLIIAFVGFLFNFSNPSKKLSPSLVLLSAISA